MRGAARSPVALAVALGVVVSIALSGCAMRPPEEQESARSEGGGGGEAYTAGTEAPVEETESADVASVPQAMPATTAATGAAGSFRSRSTSVDAIVAVPRAEPAPWRGHEWALAPAVAPRVMLATVELPPGDAFRPPATSCQDVILFVRSGQLEATGTGIAPSDAPVTMYPGDAARFGPEGDGVAVNVGTTRARTVMAIARRADTGAARVPPPHDDTCSVAAAHPDPLMRPLRFASISTTPPLSAAGGRLEVRILLDDDRGGGHGALSWLDGAPDLVVPEHMHPGAAEILLVEEGEGTMRIGDREIAVRAGSAIYVPEDTLHSFRGAGTVPLRALQIYAPGGPEQRFRP